MSQNFGDTISDGIQDVSALLPLLGTEQCEQHVGDALEKGYLYAAAAPLSIFGSLGIVRTAFATFLATTTRPFYGGTWLDDAGFGSEGSATSMAMITKGTKQYGAEINLQRLLREQHIDDPDLVSDIDWFGWKERAVNGVDSPSLRLVSWNLCLIATSTLFSAISLAPYLYLIHTHWEEGILWLFPLLRSIGSLLCVVSIQLALQLRIHRVTSCSLLLMQARRRYSSSIEDTAQVNDTLMETRLRTLQSELRSKHLHDPEKGFEEKIQRDKEKLDSQLSFDVPLLLFQVLMLAGMGMIVAGYVGCFNLVSRSDAAHGPYIWLGMETFLSFLRMILWGWNPTWDERNTGLVMRLKIRGNGPEAPLPLPNSGTKDPHDVFMPFSEPGHHPDDLPTSPIFPLITAPYHLSQLTTDEVYTRKQRIARKLERESFIAESAEDFLTAATPYVGPLRRLALEGVSLFVAVIPNGTASEKLLCTTVRRNDSKRTSVSIFFSENGSTYTIYSSSSTDLPGTQALQVTLGKEVTSRNPSLVK